MMWCAALLDSLCCPSHAAALPGLHWLLLALYNGHSLSACSNAVW